SSNDPRADERLALRARLLHARSRPRAGLHSRRGPALRDLTDATPRPSAPRATWRRAPGGGGPCAPLLNLALAPLALHAPRLSAARGAGRRRPRVAPATPAPPGPPRPRPRRAGSRLACGRSLARRLLTVDEGARPRGEEAP